MKATDLDHPLEQVLQRHAAAPEAQALLARVANEEHLTAEELALLSRPDVDPEAKELRRARQHLLLCETCNPAWLGAELREAETPHPPFQPAPPARAWPKYLALGVALFVVGGLLHLAWPAPPIDPNAGRDLSIAPLQAPKILHLTWIGRGGRGPAQERPADRLFAEVQLANGRSEGHLFLFLVGETRVEILHPKPADGAINPLKSGVIPGEGWTFPSANDRWIGVVGIALPREHGFLREEGDRREIALEMTRLLQRGRPPTALAELLRGLPASAEGDVILSPLYSLR